MVIQVACFFTCGYTEAGTMQLFLKKINNACDFVQCLPNKTRKRRGESKSIRNEYNGLSGNALLERVCTTLKKYKNEVDISRCQAVLIEDDLDGRFRDWTDGEVNAYREGAIRRIHECLGRNVPVIFLYASPEIEAWFLADWKKSFQYVYENKRFVEDLSVTERRRFLYHLRKFIFINLLGDYRDDLETYGWVENQYVKLSDQLQDAVSSVALQQAAGIQSQHLYYSKKRHGEIMLREICPSIVAKKCRRYFLQGYQALRNL